jgi:hypothetical protein
LPLNPGLYAISVAAPGHATKEFSVALAEGDAVEVPVFVGESSSTPPRPAVGRATGKAESVDANDDDPKNRKMFAYVGVSGGAAAFTLGVVTGLIGLHQEAIGNSNCSDATRTCNQRGYDANQTAKSLATVSTVGLVVGILSGGVGTYLWLTLPRANEGELGVGGTAGSTLLQWRSRW